MSNVTKGKVTLYVDHRDEIAFIDAKVGKRKKRFHRREYPDGETMARAFSAWMKGHGVTLLAHQTRVLTAEELLAEAIAQQITFACLIASIAEEAQGLETWDDFGTDVLADLARTDAMHIGYVETVFAKIKQAFTPATFCELAVNRVGYLISTVPVGPNVNVEVRFEANDPDEEVNDESEKHCPLD